MAAGGRPPATVNPADRPPSSDHAANSPVVDLALATTLSSIYGSAHPPASSRSFDLGSRILRGEPIESAMGGKEGHTLDVVSAVELLIRADAQAISGQSFNSYDLHVDEEPVGRIAKELMESGQSHR